MRKAVARFVFAAVAILLSAHHAGAQFGFGDYPDPTGSPLCSDYVTYWVAAAKAAKDKRCSPGGPEWSTDVKVQADFCFSSSDSEKAARTSDMKQAMVFCASCANSVDFRMTRIVDNILYRCGFSNPDGRWTPNREYHLKKCMAAAANLSVAGFTNFINGPIYSTASEMQRQVDACKETNPNKNCVSCHSSQSSSAVRTSPKSGAAFQDAIPRLSRPTKTNTKSGNDLSYPSDTPSRRATPPKGSNTSGNDLAKPSDETGRRNNLGPGLLDSDTGFSTSAPAAAGAPAPQGGGGRSRPR
jgi:hypothetical protein